MGFDDERSLGGGEDGARSAGPIWMSYIARGATQRASPDAGAPNRLIDVKISPYTGTLADPMDPEAIYETFMLEHQPRVADPGDSGYRPFGTGADGSGGSEPLF